MAILAGLIWGGKNKKKNKRLRRNEELQKGEKHKTGISRTVSSTKEQKKKWDSGERDSEVQVTCVYTHVHDYAQTHTHTACVASKKISRSESGSNKCEKGRPQL